MVSADKRATNVYALSEDGQVNMEDITESRWIKKRKLNISSIVIGDGEVALMLIV